MSGLTSYCAGLAAEDQVADMYARNGFEIVARRWRKSAGEIDLIARHEQKFYFVEVKKGRDFATAVARISEQQLERIQTAALEFLCQSGLSMDTECRFDAALADAQGRIKVIPQIA
jgi:putative endonuclease